MSLIDLIFDFYQNHVFYWNVEGNYDYISEFFSMEKNGYVLNFAEYLSLLATIVTIVFIVVLCCLFVYKIIKLVGNLIR